MRTLAILIHGFNVWDGGRATVGKLRPFFGTLGVPYVMVSYGWLGLIRTRLKNKRIARRVAQAAKAAKAGGSRVIVVGHSNGCAIAHLAARLYGAPIDVAVYINPALEPTTPRPNTIRKLQVWHSPSDRPVRWARFLLPSSARPWGAMGAVGSTIEDPSVVNINKQVGYRVSSRAHSDLFDIEQIGYWGPLVAVSAIGATR